MDSTSFFLEGQRGPLLGLMEFVLFQESDQPKQHQGGRIVAPDTEICP